MTRLLFRSAGFGLFSDFALAVILVAGTFTSLPTSLHVRWLGAIVLVSLGRLGLNLAFLAGVAGAGFIWGLAGSLDFKSPQLLPRLLLGFLLAGPQAGAARSLAAMPPSCRDLRRGHPPSAAGPLRHGG